MQRDHVARCQQLVDVHVCRTEFARRGVIERRALGVGDRHAERLRASRRGDADLAHAHDAELPTLNTHAEHVEHAPLPRGARTNDAFALAHPSGRGQHECHGDVCGGLGEHAGGVGHADAALGAGRNVDVVVPHRHVRHQTQLRPGGIQQFGVHLLRQERQDRIGTLDPRQQLRSVDRLVRLPCRHIVHGAQPLHGLTGNAARDDDACHRQPAIQAPKRLRPSSMSSTLIPENAKRM